MSATQPNNDDPRFQYSEMSDMEARTYLTSDFGVESVDEWKNYIIGDYSDVLYFADAFGDLETAVKLAPFDKTLPDSVFKGLADSNLDLLEAVNCHDITTERCAGCDTELFEIEISEPGKSHTSRQYMDEHGNLEDYSVFVSDPGGRFWNTEPEPDHAPILCPVCSMSTDRDFPTRLGDYGSVVVHYGESNEISTFSVWNGIVRFEEGYNHEQANWTDLWNCPGKVEDMTEAFSTSNQAVFMAKHGWKSVTHKNVFDKLNEDHYIGRVSRRNKRNLNEIIEKWAKGSETNPDLGFTYFMDFSSSSRTSRLWCESENKDELIEALADQYEQENLQ